jgi:hypothetical protein
VASAVRLVTPALREAGRLELVEQQREVVRVHPADVPELLGIITNVMIISSRSRSLVLVSAEAA